MSVLRRGSSSPQVKFQDQVGASSLFPHDDESVSLLVTEAEREVHSLQKLLLKTKNHLKETEIERRSGLTNLHEEFPRRGSSSSSSAISRSDSPIARRASWLSHVNNLDDDQMEGLDKKVRTSGLESTPGKGSVDAMWKDWKAASPLATSALRMNSPVVEAILPEPKGKPDRDAPCLVGKKNSHSLCQDEMRRACDAMADMAKQDMLSLESELLEFTRTMEYDFEQEKAAKAAEMEQMRTKFRSRLESLEGELSNARKEKEKIQTKLQEELLTATQRNGRVALELSEEIQKRKRIERELRSWKDQAATMQQALESSDVRVGALEHALAAALQRQEQEGASPTLPVNQPNTAFRKQDHSLSPLIVETEGQAQWDVDQAEEGPAMQGMASQVEHESVGGLFPSAIDEAEQFLAMVGEEHAKEIEILELQHQQALAKAAEERDAVLAQLTALKSQWAYQHYQAVKLRGLKEHGYGGVTNNLETMVGELAALMQELSGVTHTIADAPVVVNSEKISKGKGKDGERIVHVPFSTSSASPSGGQNPAGNPSTPCTHPDGIGNDGQSVKGNERGPTNAHRQSICSFGLPEVGLDSPDSDAEPKTSQGGGEVGGKNRATERVSSFDQKVQTGLELLSQQSEALPLQSYTETSNVKPEHTPGTLTSNSALTHHGHQATPSKLQAPNQAGTPASTRTWFGSPGSPSSSPATQAAEQRLKELQRLAAQAMNLHAQAVAEALDLSQSVRADASHTTTPAATPQKLPHAAASSPSFKFQDSDSATRTQSQSRAGDAAPHWQAQARSCEHQGPGLADSSSRMTGEAASRRGLFQAPGGSGPSTPGSSRSLSSLSAGVQPRAGSTPSPSKTTAKSLEAHRTQTSSSGLVVKIKGVRARIRCREQRSRESRGPHLSIASEAVEGGAGAEVRRTVAQGRVVKEEVVDHVGGAGVGGAGGVDQWVDVAWDQPFEHVVYEGKQRFTMSCFDVGGENLALLGGVTVAAGKLLASAMQGEGEGQIRLALHDGNGRRVGELDVTIQICK